MNTNQKLDFLIKYLNADIDIPVDVDEKFDLFHALMNIQLPRHLSDEYIKVQGEVLQEKTREKGIVEIDSLEELKENIYLWRGDITRLKVDGIVNAANSKMLGCFVPLHKCIDNAIHTYAGLELRNECDNIMTKQGHDEKTGDCKITKGYNLPAKHVLHTVGPIIYNKVNEIDRINLESCYNRVLETADENKLESIAFCCISTGEFRFPKIEASKIAVKTVKDYMANKNKNIKKVVFNVFLKEDFLSYRREI